MKTNRTKKTTGNLRSHPMWSPHDFAYLRGKGYTIDEIRAIWDRDLASGKEPIQKFAKVPDIVGYLNTK